MRCVYFASVVALAALPVFAGCKAETTTSDRPETLARLAEYERAVADKDRLIKQQSERIDELDDGVVIKLQGPEVDGTPGPIVEIVGRGPNARATGGGGGDEPTQSDVDVYKAFVGKVDGSHGRMRKCYEAALKANSELQAKTVMLHIKVRYFTTGEVSTATFLPEISPEFARCATAVARSWTLNPLPEPISVEYQTRLKPQ
jgi:hypothetical protein